MDAIDLGPYGYMDVVDGPSASGSVLATFRQDGTNPLYVQSVSSSMTLYLRNEYIYEEGMFNFTVYEGMTPHTKCGIDVLFYSE